MIPPSSDHLQSWASRIKAGDRRAVARAISAVEAGTPEGVGLLKLIFVGPRRAYAIGVTGSPGAGKSTLVEKLGAEYRACGVRVGIIAVDPTSPFSGGAILGDRIRMPALSLDEGVYIRSMATRGQLGGLAPAAHDVVAILEASGCEVVLIETVGVGQDEVDIARLADATALILVPGMGDDVQAFKAGLMEIADVFVINKADRPGADRLEQELTAALSVAPHPPAEWRPPILRTVATTGEGARALREALDTFRASSQTSRLALTRHRAKVRARLLELLRQTLFEKVVRDRLTDEAIDARVDEIVARRSEPHEVVEGIIASALAGG